MNHFGESVPNFVGAWYYTQAPGIFGNRVQVKSHLNRHVLAVYVTIRMPTRIADVVVTITRRIVEVIAEKRASDPNGTWIVQKPAHVLVLVDEGE